MSKGARGSLCMNHKVQNTGQGSPLVCEKVLSFRAATGAYKEREHLS